MILPVTVNHTGPCDFLVDTGTRFTTLDRSLALELQMRTQGEVQFVGAGASQKASFTRIDLLETVGHKCKSGPPWMRIL